MLFHLSIPLDAPLICGISLEKIGFSILHYASKESLGQYERIYIKISCYV